MKKISIALSLLALTGSQVQTVSAGEQEWATAGKVLTGVFAAQAVASVFAPPPVYQTTVYYPGGPVYAAAPAYVAAQPPAYVQPAPVYVAQPPVAYYAPPAYVQPYPGYYYAPRPVFSFILSGRRASAIQRKSCAGNIPGITVFLHLHAIQQG